MIGKKSGFTLVETLITLGIIGVIAGLSIPLAISGRMAAQAKGQFNTAYALLQHAVADMSSSGIELQQSLYIGVEQNGRAASNSIYNKFKPFLKISYDCGAFDNVNPKICASTDERGYEGYSGNSDTQLNTIVSNGSFVLQNGMLVAFSGTTRSMNLFVTVDINGKNKLPNKWGWDVFTFQVLDGELVPAGAPGTGYEPEHPNLWGNNPRSYCDPNSNAQSNGATCAYYALNDDEYFKTLYRGH